MRTITPDSKARIIALTIGYALLATLLLGFGVTSKVDVEDLDPRPQLERLIPDQIAEELAIIEVQQVLRHESAGARAFVDSDISDEVHTNLMSRSSLEPPVQTESFLTKTPCLETQMTPPVPEVPMSSSPLYSWSRPLMA